jgi:hypothetical protein
LRGALLSLLSGWVRGHASAILILMAAAAAGCSGSEPSSGSSRAGGAAATRAPVEDAPGRGPAIDGAAAADSGDHEAELAALLAFEDERRRTTDFAQLPSADVALGANPYQLRRLSGERAGSGSARAVGLLRGADAVVLLDAGGRELARIAAPPSPTALAADRGGRIWVGGTGSRELAVYRASQDPARLERAGSFAVDGAWTVRALAASRDGDWLYAADERTGQVTALEIRARGAPRQRSIGRCREPIQLAPAGPWLVVNCLAEHALLAYPLDARGRPTGAAPLRIELDGPLWSLAAAPTARGVLVAAGGVEDHPLERREGGFGYIDSFLYMYVLPAGPARAPRRLAEVDLSAAGVVTPKWVSVEVGAGDRVTVRTAGYATSVLATLTWPALGDGAAPVVESEPFVPGTTDWLALGDATDRSAGLAASPLLDAWIATGRGDRPSVALAHGVGRAVGRAPRSAESRVGEALFFTTLMAPWNRSEGKLSRFTCETCHFEAHGDGRVHYTGRGKVHSSTKPLRGLLNNRPHFTRALDRTMTQMVHAEFRVANRWSGRDPWFALAAADFPWLAAIDGVPSSLSPIYLRRALMTFLMELTFEPNQAVRGRHRFAARERAGAELFRDRCESCHGARLVTDEPATAVPFDRWEELVFSPQGPIVWASAEYRKTGVEPYVHPEGARTTSLRRLHHKFPYFTSGSARSLADVMARAAWAGGRFFHDRAPPEAEVERLNAEQQAALVAFLELL